MLIFPYRVNGLQPQPNKENLKINVEPGILMAQEETFPFAGKSQIQFRYMTENDLCDLLVTDVDPGHYDSQGLVSQVQGDPNQATIQRIYITKELNFRIQFGKVVFKSLNHAITQSLVEHFTPNPLVRQESAVLIGLLAITVNCKNLKNKDQAIFIKSEPFQGLV